MKNENTAAQVKARLFKAQLIQRIQHIKPLAIYHGFDFPTQSLESATTQELLEFFKEIQDYVIDAEISE